jgi:hypothetical protein
MRSWRAFAGLSAVLAPLSWQQPGAALPTMVRLGYTNCASCHISPQGGGPLNRYGRGIDEAQSRRAGEYQPSDNTLVQKLNWDGRITQDIRVVASEQVTSGTNLAVLGRLRSRWMYRSVTEFGKGVRVSAMVTGENDGTPRPTLPYDHGIRRDEISLTTALVHYRPREGIEFAAGRDLLPSGIYVSDLAPFIKSRNRLGYYDTPVQAKMFWWGKRYQVSPFVFGPSGNERIGERESGGGTLVEFDVFGKQRTVVGMSLLRASARVGHRRVTGAYARLGFGKWGVLAEHDVTDRTLHLQSASFRQHATYAQWFLAVREWFVVSLVGERLSVGRPFREDLNAGKIEVAARITPNVTIALNSRLQRNVITGVRVPSVALQLAFKTVD